MKQRWDPLRFLSRLEASRGGNDKKRWVNNDGEDVFFHGEDDISSQVNIYIWFLLVFSYV